VVGIGVKVFVSVERLATKIFISSPDMMADRVGGNRSGSLPSDSASHCAAGGRRRTRLLIHPAAAAVLGVPLSLELLCSKISILQLLGY
jgi:hypothetical protein